MPQWEYRKGRWRYEFEYLGERYGKAGFKTMREARAAEERHRKRLSTPEKKAEIVMVFSDASNEYLDFAKLRYVNKTYKEKVFVHRSFIEHAGDLPLKEITALVIESYLKKRPSKPNWNKHRKNLCAFFQWCFNRRLMEVNPCLYIDKMPLDLSHKKIYTQEEMVKLVLASGDLRPFFIAIFSLAARVNEINRIRWEDVNFQNRIVTLWTRKGRTGEWREQKKGMNDELYVELDRLYTKNSGEWVFPNPETGKPFVDRRKQLKRICLEAGVPYLGFHAIRHHVASVLLDVHKVKLKTVQRMLGHTRLSTTEGYIQELSDGVREAGELLKTTTAEENPAQIPAQEKKEGQPD
ncbi:MAG: tyrosine-type recombinase/integrase [Candidatus Micrarchaeia archaeon]|jgi:integrase